MNKNYLLVAGVIALVLVAGCSSVKAAERQENINFNVVWSESYQDAGVYYRFLTKIDIPADNRECYIVANGDGEGMAMQCYNKTGV